ncbi:MAG: hypothetical protein JNK15_22205 [Planctomycetes bacterium]|nr:hypothetical protein [Planctomycetota bacterium]
MITSFRAHTPLRFTPRTSARQLRSSGRAGGSPVAQAIELLGACSMIAAFLVLALFG